MGTWEKLKPYELSSHVRRRLSQYLIRELTYETRREEEISKRDRDKENADHLRIDRLQNIREEFRP